MQSVFNPTPLANQAYQPRQGVFYAFDQDLTAPIAPDRSRRLKLRDWIFHPFETFKLYRKLSLNSQARESFGVRLSMYKELRKSLSRKGRRYLYQQLAKGRLTDNRADDNRTTLAHLYAILKNPRATGFQTNAILEETLRILAKPQTIDQKFGTLQPQALQSLSNYYNSGLGPKLAPSVGIQDLQVASSATCVASSVMYYMAHRNPSEFVRHIAELTSPRLAFYEKAWLNEISPEDPSLAARKLNEYGIPATAVPGTNGAQYRIKVVLPHSGYLRALNQQGPREPGSHGIVESAYQNALTHLVVRSYDPGLGKRINADGTLDPAGGLEEDRKTLMESIIKDNGGTMSVTYQFTASDKNSEPYLLGYYRNFDQITRDIMQAIDMGEDVIIGYTDTDSMSTPGRINMGHEITITGYQRNKKTGRVDFIVADSDDNKSHLVKRSASEIVPKIHHAGFPVKLAQKIWREIQGQLNNQYLIPTREDSTRYSLIPTVPPHQQGAFLKEYQQMLEQENDQQAQQQPAQQRPTRQEPSLRQPQAPSLPDRTHWPAPPSVPANFDAYRNAEYYNSFWTTAPVAPNPWAYTNSRARYYNPFWSQAPAPQNPWPYAYSWN